jgi:hypothetical protein
MAARPLIAGVICLVVLGVGSAIYLFKDSLFRPGSPPSVVDSGIGAARQPPRLPKPGPPPEPLTPGGAASAPAASSGPSGAQLSSAAEPADLTNKPGQPKQTAGASAGDAIANATPGRVDEIAPPSPPSINAGVKPAPESSANDRTAPPADVAVTQPEAQSPAVARPGGAPANLVGGSSPKDETAPPAKVSENASKGDTAPPSNVEAKPMAPATQPTGSPANPIAEQPAAAEKQPASPAVKPGTGPNVESSAKVAESIAAAATTLIPRPAGARVEPIDEGAPRVETKPATPPIEPPAGSQPGFVSETPTKIEASTVPPPAKPIAEIQPKEETAPATKVAESATAAVGPPVEPPASSPAGPLAETPAKIETQTVPSKTTPVAEPPAKVETPAQAATAAPSVEPSASSRTGPVSETPAKAEMQEAPFPAKPAAESSAKDETPPPPPIGALAGPLPESLAKTETPAVSPPDKPIAERPTKDETAAPVQPPSNLAAAPVAESSAPVETRRNGQESKPIVTGAAPPLPSPPASGDAKPREPAPTPDAVASNAADEGRAGASAGQLAAIVPPRAPQAMLAIDDATVGKDYAADLPPFSDPGGAKGISLHVEPPPPEGLSFRDLGSGFGEISGRPTKPGQFAFDVVASNNVGGAARMTTKINVAPAPPEPKPPPAKSEPSAQVAALEPEDKTARFLRGFDGGPCFLARAGAAIGASITIEGVGAEKQIFQRFYASFLHDVGAEPTLNVRLIASPQCPVVGLIAAAQSDRAAAPTIKLAAFDVPRGKPLAGAIGAVAGRRFELLLITNDGFAHKIASRGLASDPIASFSVPITPDAGSIGVLQILVAIASSKPLDALAAFRSGPAAEILPKVAAQLGPTDAALNVEYFKFLK